LCELVEKGYTVYALAPDFSSDIKEILINSSVVTLNIGLSRVSVNPFLSIIELFKLTICLYKIKPESTLCYFAKAVVIGNFASFLSGVKNRSTIIEGLGNSQSSIKRSYIYRILYKVTYKLALFSSNSVFFTNQEDEKFFLQSNITKLENTQNIGGIGVDLNYWQCDKNQKNEGPITFIMSSRLLYSKGILIYLEAAKKIKALYGETRFLLIGGVDSNPLSISLDELKYYTEKNIVEYLGNVSNVKEIMCEADIFVLPSYYGEGLPRSIQEAMSCSMPVITTDWTGCRDTVQGNNNGILVPIKNVNSLYQAMKYYIDNNDSIDFHGKNSRLIAEKNYDVYKKASIVEKRISSFLTN